MPLPRFSPDARRYLIGACALGAASTFPLTLLALYIDQLGASKTEVGWVVSGSSWGNLLAALPAAILVSRLPPSWILTSSALLTGFCYLAQPWPLALWALFSLNLAGGFAFAIHQVGGAPLLYRHSDPGERPAVFALSEAARMAASVLGALAAGWLASRLSERLGDTRQGHALALACGGLLPLLAALPYARIEDSSVRTRAAQRLFGGLARHQGLVLRFALPQLLIAVGSGMTIPFMSLYFRERFGFHSDAVGMLFAGGQVGMTLGFLGGPALYRRLGYVRAIALAQFASLPWFAVLALTHWAPLAVLAYLLRTALMNAAHPLMKAFLMESSPEELREAQNALLMLLYGLGWVVGPWLGGLVLDRTHGDYGALMAVTIGFYVVGTSAFVWRLSSVERQLRSYREAAAPSYSP